MHLPLPRRCGAHHWLWNRFFPGLRKWGRVLQGPGSVLLPPSETSLRLRATSWSVWSYEAPAVAHVRGCKPRFRETPPPPRPGFGITPLTNEAQRQTSIYFLQGSTLNLFISTPFKDHLETILFTIDPNLWGFRSVPQTQDGLRRPELTFRALRAALRLGYRHVDCAAARAAH